MLAYADKHGIGAAAEHYEVHASMLYSWKRNEPAESQKTVSRRKSRAPSKPVSHSEEVEELRQLVIELTLENRKLRSQLAR